MKGKQDIYTKPNENYVMERVSYIEQNILSGNKDYVAQRDIQEKLIKQIQYFLPEEHKILVLRLNDAANYQSIIAQSVCYEQGFKDSSTYKSTK